MLEKIKSDVDKKPVIVAVMHAYAPEPAKNLMGRLIRELNCRDIWLTEFSPLMGYACGTGTLGIAYIAAES